MGSVGGDLLLRDERSAGQGIGLPGMVYRVQDGAEGIVKARETVAFERAAEAVGEQPGPFAGVLGVLVHDGGIPGQEAGAGYGEIPYFVMVRREVLEGVVAPAEPVAVVPLVQRNAVIVQEVRRAGAGAVP